MISNEKIAEIRRFLLHYSLSEVAAKCGVCRQTVAKVRDGMTENRQQKRREEIASLAKRTSVADAAIEFGLSRQRVYVIMQKVCEQEEANGKVG